MKFENYICFLNFLHLYIFKIFYEVFNYLLASVFLVYIHSNLSLTFSFLNLVWYVLIFYAILTAFLFLFSIRKPICLDTTRSWCQDKIRKANIIHIIGILGEWLWRRERRQQVLIFFTDYIPGLACDRTGQGERTVQFQRLNTVLRKFSESQCHLLEQFSGL